MVFRIILYGLRYDFDIIATTDSKQFMDGRYPNQRVVTYTAKKPHKKLFTEEDLFSFGTQIGQIKNWSDYIVIYSLNVVNLEY